MKTYLKYIHFKNIPVGFCYFFKNPTRQFGKNYVIRDIHSTATFSIPLVFFGFNMSNSNFLICTQISGHQMKE